MITTTIDSMMTRPTINNNSTLVIAAVKRMPALQEAKRELLALMGDPGPFMG